MHSGQNQISPCNNKCIMDPVTNYCKGCFRTIEEIIQWTHFSVEEKNQILQQAEIRKSSSRKNKHSLL
ncbi:MAG: DUF1289 domain-containing protein [Melioribacteraceae bacterium]